MKQVKVFFEDFWPGFDCKDNFITKIIRKGYTIILDPNPDYLFFSVYGHNHLRYRNCIKIFYSAENIEPDFNLCDYAIAFQHQTCEDRYLRYPLYVESGLEHMGQKTLDREKLLNRKFCNFVYSNFKWADPIRDRFFKVLSDYKKVDSGGRHLNNIGGPVDNKQAFIKDYKFTIAFENSSLSGYTTEKIVEPMIVDSMPIYWGNPKIHLDFNKESFIFVNDYPSIEKAVEEIIRLDNDDEAYLQKMAHPWYTGDNYQIWQLQLQTFLGHIFEQTLSDAHRTTSYGYVRPYRRKQETMGRLSAGKIMRFSLFNKEITLLLETKK